MATASTTLNSGQPVTTSSPSEHRQGNRKRKQDMPPPAAQEIVSQASTNAANLERQQEEPQINMPIFISAFVTIFNIPEPIAQECAESLISRKKQLTYETLFEECESRYPSEALQAYSYMKRLGTSDDHNLVEADAVVSSSSTHVNEGLIASSSTELDSISRTKYPSVSRHSNGLVQGESRRGSSIESSVPHQTSDLDTVSHSSTQIQDPLGVEEDYTDGCAPTQDGVGYHLSRQIQIAATDTSTPFSQIKTSEVTSCNGLDRAHHMPGSRTTKCSQSPRHQSDRSGIETDNGNSASSNAEGSPTDVELSLQPSTDYDLTGSLEGATAQPKGEANSNVRHSFSSSAEYKRTCFRLIEKEHELLEKSRKCSQCSEKPREVTLLPCGHFTVCRECAEPIFVCPSCKKGILATVDTYLS